MELIAFEVTGTSPLITHNPYGSMKAGGGPDLGIKTIPTPDEEADGSVYRTPTGLIAIPTAAFRSCVLAAGKGRRIGKTAATTVVKGAVFVADEFSPLRTLAGEPMEKWSTDVRRVVVQRNAVLRGRARFEEWAATVHFEHDPDFIAAEQVAELLTIGGRTVGVGDYRPERSGPFGRFEVAP
jgi:hypothetical protein